MRVCVVLPGRGLFGGIRVVAIYADRLMRRGHQITIACVRRPWPRNPVRLTRWWLKQLWTAPPREDHLSGFGGQLIDCYPHQLAASLPDGDVVLATHPVTMPLVAALPASKGAHGVLIQGFETDDLEQGQLEQCWRLPLRKIVVSSWLRDKAASLGDDAAVLIPNGVDCGQFDAPRRSPHQPPALGYVYSPAPGKGAEMARAVAQRVRESIPELRIVTFGAVRPTHHCPLPPGAQFEWRPAQKRLAEIYASADVWLCTSQREGFGLPLLEAMACRCAVVSTRCGGPLDFIDDGVNGFLVNVDDVDTMVERVLLLLLNQPLLKCLAQAAHDTRVRFDWEQSAGLMEHTLRNWADLPTDASTYSDMDSEVRS